jgi:predicted Zn-dependent protease with MMP-like domain
VVEVPAKRFERLVADALDSIPESLAALIDNVAVIVEDESDDPTLLGLYEGVPHTERETYGIGFTMPDRILLFRKAICAMCDSEEDVVEEVMITVVHEVAHHFGIDDDELDRLGWG